jgi:hypothetical protein
MENVKLVFYGTEESETNGQELVAYANSLNSIFIKIKNSDCNHDFESQIICLSKLSAIRLVRELKKQIGYIKESEGLNG